MRNLIFSLLFLLPVVASAIITDVDRQSIFAKNLLLNGGFENGKQKWTASGGSFAIVTSGTNLMTGKVSATWDSSAASQTLAYASTTIPKGLYGKNGVAVCKIMTPSGSATHTLDVTDGSSTLSSVAITSSTVPTYSFTNFIFPSTGSVVLRLASVASNEPSITVDDCFLGDAAEINIAMISQARFIGSAYIAGTASCSWTTTSATYAAFGTTAACPGPTVELNPGPGVIQTTDTDLPKFTVNNLPPGTYKVVIEGAGQSASTALTSCFAISDATNTRGTTCSTGASGGETSMIHVEAWYTYTSSGNVSFSLFGSTSAGTLTLNNTNTGTRNLYFSIVQYPSSSEQAYRADVAPASWAGYHDSTCSWARTNVAYGDPTADTTCVFTERYNRNFGTVTSALSGSDFLPGIVFTPKRLGRYLIFATVNAVKCGSSGATQGIQMIDTAGTQVADAVMLCMSGGLYSQSYTITAVLNVTTLAAQTIKLQTKISTGALTMNETTVGNAINWTITALDQAYPMPVIVNSVTTGSSGVTKFGAATVAAGCITATTNDQGMYASGVSNSTGNCTLTWATGYFSAVPTCICTAAVANTNRVCSIDKNTTQTATVIRVATYAAASATAEADDIHIVCIGKP